MRRNALFILMLTICSGASADVENMGAAITDSSREKANAYKQYLAALNTSNSEQENLVKKLEGETSPSESDGEFIVAMRPSED